MKEISPGVFQLGLVRCNKEQPSVSFPAQVNLRDGNIEYLIVTTTGKTHESLLRTEARPFQIQVALLLLGARGTTNELPTDPAQSLAGESLEVLMRWKIDGQQHEARIEKFVTDRRLNQPARQGPWVYTGSRLREDGFAAEVDGSIVSLITDSDALINNPRPGREDDDNWLVRAEGLPATGTSVEVMLKLRKGKN